jgi:hypothetical protein
MDMATDAPSPPVQWYYQPWPWLLMLAPLAAMLAGVSMLALALHSDDGLVADDYYKRGLAINQSLDRTDAAVARDIRARVEVEPDGSALATVSARDPLAPVLRLRLIHPTRAGHDRTAELLRGPDGAYHGRVADYVPGRWRVGLETDAWRLPPVETAGSTLHAALGR